MKFFLDIIFLVIFTIIVILTAKRGFFASVLRVVSVTLSIIISITVAPALSEMAYNGFIKDKVYTSVVEWTDGKLNEAASLTVEKVDSLVEELPAIIRGYYNATELSEEIVAEAIENNTVDVNTFAASLCENLLDPAIATLLNYVFAFILFSLVIILCRFLLRFFDRLFKGNFIGRINTLLGGLLGIVFAFALTVVLCFLLRFIDTFFYIEKLEALLQNSYIYGFISGLI